MSIISNISSDKHTCTRWDPAEEKEVVDHGRSATNNLKAAGKDVLDIVNPFNHTVGLLKNIFGTTSKYDCAYRDAMVSGVAKVFGKNTFSAILSMVAAEAIDVVACPVKAVKNVVDAAVHGVKAGRQ